MKLGLFMMPMHPPAKPHAAGYDTDMETLIRADELGYDALDQIIMIAINAYRPANSRVHHFRGSRGFLDFRSFRGFRGRGQPGASTGTKSHRECFQPL